MEKEQMHCLHSSVRGILKTYEKLGGIPTLPVRVEFTMDALPRAWLMVGTQQDLGRE